MEYYKIISYTPFSGEEACNYIASEDIEEICSFAEDVTMENADNWYNEDCEEYGYTEEDYYNECYYILEEIDEETFKKESRYI